MSLFWLQINSLTSFFSNLTDGNFFIKTSLTRKKRGQKLRVHSKIDYINFSIRNSQLQEYSITDKPENKTKLISIKQSSLVKHTRKDYKLLHEELQEFLNNQLPK